MDWEYTFKVPVFRNREDCTLQAFGLHCKNEYVQSAPSWGCHQRIMVRSHGRKHHRCCGGLGYQPEHAVQDRQWQRSCDTRNGRPSIHRLGQQSRELAWPSSRIRSVAGGAESRKARSRAVACLTRGATPLTSSPKTTQESTLTPSGTVFLTTELPNPQPNPPKRSITCMTSRSSAWA